MKRVRRILMLGCVMAMVCADAAHADALSALAGQKDLTPEKLIRSFAEFAFELNAQPQDAETFLQRKRGDCDDFASLASRLLSGRGYKTKLVVVMMEQESHVVCYVKEAHGFLDFNHRADTQPIIQSDGSLEDIAQKVGGDFRSRWQMASEVRYENDQPLYLDNVFPSLEAPKKAVATAAPVATQKEGVTNTSSVLLATSTVPADSKNLAQLDNESQR